MEISAAQTRAARALLDWSQEQLAENAQVARATVADFERDNRAPMRQNLVAIRASLEAAGIQFIPENGGGAGVRFRKVELEFESTAIPDGDGVMIPVRFREVQYRATITREVLDDLDGANHRTFNERAASASKHLPLILRAIEDKLSAGDLGKARRLIIAHADFPAGTF
jgi:transcriptional regulator with XRE-family HTH domain